MPLLSKIYAGAAIVALICSPTVLSEIMENPKVAPHKAAVLTHQVPHVEAVAHATQTKSKTTVFSRLKPAAKAEPKSGVNRLLSKTLTPHAIPASKKSDATVDVKDTGVFKFTRSVAYKGRKLFNSLVRSVEDAADGTATKLFRTLQLPNLPTSPLPSITSAVGSVEHIPKAASTGLVPKADGPRLSDAWLNEVSNEPNMDFERLLGWDVYLYANRTIIPSAQACLTGAQEALYQLSEKQVLLFSNCIKSKGANITNHHECQCFATHDRQGTAISSNVWQLGGCCTEEVLEFNEAAAEINVNRSAVLNLADACLARCSAAARGLATPSQIIPLLALGTALLFML